MPSFSSSFPLHTPFPSLEGSNEEAVDCGGLWKHWRWKKVSFYLSFSDGESPVILIVLASGKNKPFSVLEMGIKAG